MISVGSGHNRLKDVGAISLDVDVDVDFALKDDITVGGSLMGRRFAVKILFAGCINSVLFKI